MTIPISSSLFLDYLTFFIVVFVFNVIRWILTKSKSKINFKFVVGHSFIMFLIYLVFTLFNKEV